MLPAISLSWEVLEGQVLSNPLQNSIGEILLDSHITNRRMSTGVRGLLREVLDMPSGLLLRFSLLRFRA